MGNYITGDLKLWGRGGGDHVYYDTTENRVTFTKLSPYELNFDELK